MITAENSQLFLRKPRKVENIQKIIGISKKIREFSDIIGKGYLSAENCRESEFLAFIKEILEKLIILKTFSCMPISAFTAENSRLKFSMS